MNNSRFKLETVMSARQLHILYARLADEDRYFNMRVRRSSRGIFVVKIITYSLSAKHFSQLMKSLKKAW